MFLETLKFAREEDLRKYIETVSQNNRFPKATVLISAVFS